MMKLTGSGANGKYTADKFAVISLDEVKKMILSQDSNAFDKKTSAKKKSVANKTPAKKAAKKK